MQIFDYSEKFCRLIFECIEDPWFSIMMNETFDGFFELARGLRHGDPISPYLFIIIEEVLSLMMKIKYEVGRISHFYYLRGCPLISHLLYVDDLLVFTKEA